MFFVLRPVRVQAWREANEIAGRELCVTASGWRETASPSDVGLVIWRLGDRSR